MRPSVRARVCTCSCLLRASRFNPLSKSRNRRAKGWWSRALVCFKSLGALALVCLRFFDQNRRKMKTKKQTPAPPTKKKPLPCLLLVPWRVFVPRQRTSASSGLRTHFFKQEHGDSRHNCHVAMEANTTRLDGGPRQHKNTVSTEDRVMSAHMRVDHQVGENNDVVKAVKASPRLYCAI